MRQVTERDFRLPEFRDANPDDYEFRGDGKIVRKDRWETGIHRIKNLIDPHSKEFEIDELVERIKEIHNNPLSINSDLINALSWAIKKIDKGSLPDEDDRDQFDWASEVLDNALAEKSDKNDYDE